MNQIDNIMALAKEYRDATLEGGIKRQVLRAAIEKALAVQPKQEPVAWVLEWSYSGDCVGRRLYDDETHCKFDAGQDGGICRPLIHGDTTPQPHPEQEPVGEVLDERGEVDYFSYVPEPGSKLYTAPQPKQEPVQFDVTIDGNKAKLLWYMLGEDREDLCDVRLLAGFGHSGYGLYVASADYPEDGADLLAAITTPQLQPEKNGGTK